MLNYEKWKLLNETLAPMTLGLATKTSLGLHGAQFSDIQNDEETKNEMHDDDDGCGCGDSDHHHSHHHHHDDVVKMDDMDDDTLMSPDHMDGEDEEGMMDDMGDEDEEFEDEDEDEDEEFEDDEDEFEDDEDEEDDEEDEDLEVGEEMSFKDKGMEEDETEMSDEDGDTFKITGDYMAKENTKTWWESVSDMVGSKGLYKNASEFMAEAVGTEEEEEEEEEEKGPPVSGAAKMAMDKFQTFMKQNKVEGLSANNVKSLVKGLLNHILENNQKVPKPALKKILTDIMKDYM